jgi:hypothetical protein
LAQRLEEELAIDEERIDATLAEQARAELGLSNTRHRAYGIFAEDGFLG